MNQGPSDKEYFLQEADLWTIINQAFTATSEFEIERRLSFF